MEPWNSALLGWEAWLTSTYTTCYHVKFGSFATKGVRINRWEPQNWGAPIGVGAWLTPNNKPPPHMCYHVKFGSSATKGVRINRKQPKIWMTAWEPAPVGMRAWLTPIETIKPLDPHVMPRQMLSFCWSMASLNVWSDLAIYNVISQYQTLLRDTSGQVLFRKLSALEHSLHHLLPPLRKCNNLRDHATRIELPEFSSNLRKMSFVVHALHFHVWFYIWS